jgi:hypothetical protein
MAERVVAIKSAVRVWEGDEPCEITIIQKSKSVWTAVGQYMGKTIEVKGRSAASAAALWRDAAHYRSN